MISTAAIALLAFGVAVLTLFSGFGLGTLLMPAFALVLPADAAVASTAVVHLANNLFKAGLLAGHVDRAVLLRFGLPAVVAAFGGALVLAALADQAALVEWEVLGRPAVVTPLKLCLGVLVVGFALLELVPALRRLRAPVRWLPLGGALSGFFGGLSGHQGALRAAFLAPLGLAPPAFAATQAAIALLVDGARLLVYGWALLRMSGAVAPLPWGLITVATLAAFAGSLVGRRLLPTMTLAGVRAIVGVLLLVVGVALATGIA